MKRSRGIPIPPLDSCPSRFHPHVRTVPVCNVNDSCEEEINSYCLAALAPLAITPLPTPSVETAGIGGLGTGRKAITTANLRNELPELDPKNLPKWVEGFSEILLLTGQQHPKVKTKCTLIKKSCKKKFCQGQAKTAIRRSSTWGDFLKRLDQMYPVYERDMSVRSKIEELPSLPKLASAARI